MARGTRKAEFEIGARSRKLDRGLREANRKLKRFGGRAAKDINKSFAGVKRSLGTLAGFAGIGAFGMMAKQAFAFEKRLTRLGIQGGRAAAEMAQLGARMRQVSDAMGISRDSILDGVEGYVTLTGDIDGASSAMETFAKVASASGAEMADIASTAAAMSQNLKIDPSDFEQAFSTLLSQGKAGAVELKELSSLLASLTSQFPQFGNVGVEGLAELGAMLQVVRQGFGSGSEAATGLGAAMTAITRNAARFEKAGVQVYTTGPGGKKELRGLLEIFEAIWSSGLMKDPTKLQKAFGSTEAFRAFVTAAKGSGEIEKLYEAGLKSNAVQEDHLTMQASAAARMERAWERLRNKIFEAITPERIEKFASAMEVVADIVSFLADHIKLVGAGLLALKLGPGLLSLVTFVRELKAAGGLKTLLAGAGDGAGAAGKTFGAAAAAMLGWELGRYIDDKLGISSALEPGAEHRDASTVAGMNAIADDYERQARTGERRVEKNQSTARRGWGFASMIGGGANAIMKEGSRFEYVKDPNLSSELSSSLAAQWRARAKAKAERDAKIAAGRRELERREKEASDQLYLDVNVKSAKELKTVVDAPRKGRNNR